MDMSREKDALFAEWCEDRESKAPRPLASWIALYPAHAADLMAWASAAPIIDAAAGASVDPPDLERTLRSGRRVVAEARAVHAAPLAGLIAAAKARGWSAETLARRVGVGTSVMVKLDRRLIRFDTLPGRLFRAVGEALEVADEAVRAYLQRPPTLSPAASYKADRAPRVTSQQSFADAVRACGEMDAEQKQSWLRRE